jgi:hypothetical protein
MKEGGLSTIYYSSFGPRGLLTMCSIILLGRLDEMTSTNGKNYLQSTRKITIQACTLEEIKYKVLAQLIRSFSLTIKYTT